MLVQVLTGLPGIQLPAAVSEKTADDSSDAGTPTIQGVKQDGVDGLPSALDSPSFCAALPFN